MYLCIHVSCSHMRAHICAFPVHACVLVCGPATQHLCEKKKRKKKTWGRKLVLVDFPAKMLILTAKNLRTCVFLLSAFKMRRSATRPPISMWSVLPWPTQFPLCPLAIVSPCRSCPRSWYFHTSVCSLQLVLRVSQPPPPPPPLHSTLQTFLPECCRRFPLFPICLSSPSWGRGRDLCFLRPPVIAISCCRWSTRRWCHQPLFWLAAGWTREVVVVIVNGELPN